MRDICGKTWEYVKTRWYGLVILAVTIAGAVFIGEIGCGLVDMAPNQEVKHDTIYLRPSKADSLLEEIAAEVKDINSKIPVKKTGRRRRASKKDTIRVDATIHLDKVE